MKAIDFEEFAAQRGGYPNFGDCGMHKTSDHVSGVAKARAIRREIDRGAALQQARAELRAEYDQLVEGGHIRPLTRQERLERNAQGHPDRPATQAAMRLLAKRAMK